MSKKWSIQVSKSIRDLLKTFCKENGYSMSGFVEKAILTQITGSIEFKQNGK